MPGSTVTEGTCGELQGQLRKSLKTSPGHVATSSSLSQNGQSCEACVLQTKWYSPDYHLPNYRHSYVHLGDWRLRTSLAKEIKG